MKFFRSIKNVFTRSKTTVVNTYRKQTYRFRKPLPVTQKLDYEVNERSLGLVDMNDRLDATVKPKFQGSINRQIRTQHSRLLDICRDLALNSPYGARYVQMSVDNIVGTGLYPRTQMTLPNGDLDKRTNLVIDKMFYRWAENKSRFSLNSQFDFYQFCQMVERQRETDGEVFVIIHKEDGDIKLEMVTADRCDITHEMRIDEDTVIKNGITYDERTMKPLSYWFKKIDLFSDSDTGTLEEYDADEVIHYYDTKQCDQRRGFSDFIPVIQTVAQLDSYVQISLVQARVTASSMGFITQADKSNGLDEEDDEDQPEIMAEFSPGTINMLNPGQDIKSIQSNTQANEFASWMDKIETTIAMGLGCFKQALTGDISGVNYSSSRFGDLMQQNRYQALQRHLINTVLTRVYREFLQNLVDEELIEVNVIRAMYETDWIKPQARSVDPEKDIKAKVLEIDNGLVSRREVIESLGRDPDKVELKIKEDTFNKSSETNAINTPVMAT